MVYAMAKGLCVTGERLAFPATTAPGSKIKDMAKEQNGTTMVWHTKATSRMIKEKVKELKLIIKVAIIIPANGRQA